MRITFWHVSCLPCCPLSGNCLSFSYVHCEHGRGASFIDTLSFPINANCLFTDKPKLLSVTPGNITVKEYEDVSLGAVVEGNPAPYVAWISQNGSVLQNKTEQLNYTIANITRKGRGKYQCVATNPVAKDSKDFVINVKCKFATVHQVDGKKALSQLLHSTRHILIRIKGDVC